MRLLRLGATHHGLPAACALRLALHEARGPAEARPREAPKPAESGPTIGQQRHELALRLLGAWRPETLVDLGCGDGALMPQPPALTLTLTLALTLTLTLTLLLLCSVLLLLFAPTLPLTLTLPLPLPLTVPRASPSSR